jgi:nitrate/nitrite-specific signal transduction histidine kinase
MTGIPSDSLGLGIMRERAEDIMASLSVQSRIGQGTEVLVVWQNVSRESKQ